MKKYSSTAGIVQSLGISLWRSLAQGRSGFCINPKSLEPGFEIFVIMNTKHGL